MTKAKTWSLGLIFFLILPPMVWCQKLTQVTYFDERGFQSSNLELNYAFSGVEVRETHKDGVVKTFRRISLNSRGKVERVDWLSWPDSGRETITRAEVYEVDLTGQRILVNHWYPGDSRPINTQVIHFSQNLLKKITQQTPARGFEEFNYEQIRSPRRWQTLVRDNEGFLTYDEGWETDEFLRPTWGYRRSKSSFERWDVTYKSQSIEIQRRSGSKVYVQSVWTFDAPLPTAPVWTPLGLPGPDSRVLMENYF